MNSTQLPQDSIKAESLTPWDAVSVVFGIVVGVSLFRAPPAVFGFAGDPWMGMGLWLMGGLLSLSGAFCFCELVTTYPILGAEFVFLAKAYGKLAGFLFAWTQIGAILTGSVGAMAFVFADYGGEVFPVLGKSPAITASLAIAGLAAVNLAGLKAGKWMQNVLSVGKLIGLMAILVAGFLTRPPLVTETVGSGTESGFPWNIGLALVFVLYSYGGWSDAAQVATEVQNLKKNVPRVLIAGLGGVMMLYLLINAAYLHGLGYQGLCSSQAPAADLLRRAWGASSSRFVSLLVMVSALGAINGMLFSGVRLSAALGRDHQLLRFLNQWNARGVPPYSLLIITAVSLAQVLLVGTSRGQNGIDFLLTSIGQHAFPWDRFDGGFDALVAISAPTFWAFFALTSLAVPVLRLRDPASERPYKVPFYPLTPAIFLASCLYMLYSSATYAGTLSLFGLLIAILGALFFVIDWRISKPGA